MQLVPSAGKYVSCARRGPTTCTRCQAQEIMQSLLSVGIRSLRSRRDCSPNEMRMERRRATQTLTILSATAKLGGMLVSQSPWLCFHSSYTQRLTNLNQKKCFIVFDTQLKNTIKCNFEILCLTII